MLLLRKHKAVLKEANEMVAKMDGDIRRLSVTEEEQSGILDADAYKKYIEDNTEINVRSYLQRIIKSIEADYKAIMVGKAKTITDFDDFLRFYLGYMMTNTKRTLNKGEEENEKRKQFVRYNRIIKKRLKEINPEVKKLSKPWQNYIFNDFTSISENFYWVRKSLVCFWTT